MTFRNPASGSVPILGYHKSPALPVNAADDIFRPSIYGRSVRVGTGQSGHLPSQIFGDQDARALEHQSRCVMIAGQGHRARSADLLAFRRWVRVPVAAHKEHSVPLRPAWTPRSISELPTAHGVAVRCTGGDPGRDGLGGRTPAGRVWHRRRVRVRPLRFRRHERALRDMMAARLTLGGGPA